MKFVKAYTEFDRGGDSVVECEFCRLECIATQGLDFTQCPHCRKKTLPIDSKVVKQNKDDLSEYSA